MLDRIAIDEFLTDADITALGFKTRSLSDRAVALIGFQRTKTISPRSRKSYMAGDPAPLLQEVSERREAILTGALREAACEHQPVKAYLKDIGLRPKSMIDIGCGQAIPDLFFQRDYKPRFTLVDIEQTDDLYHNWAGQGSGYASLDCAKALLHDNGAAKSKVTAINPLKDPAAMEGLKADMLISFYSCGFHYPVDDYADLMVQTITDGGVVCLDLRKRYLRRRPEPLARVLDAGTMTELFEDPRSFRVVLRAD
ncbi:hypothetical protein RAZWK3B_05347 [Roseobacter sp. AzwK-3b]|uniref:hypothetical protein n=1 Tax=Roseobacter sp. AzwK-3b TaxID=351016 RepID=UPI000156AD96|nr:hypothetical protein [Roseobacter sp. AzwK-3b]EDM70544.1 hypothetical protein RAZWK3B_05347 [Roseobacter sp. AzwK-3b]